MSTRRIHIEAKPRDVEQAVDVLRGALASRLNPRITPQEACVLTGLPLDITEPALVQLALRTRATLEPDDDGVLHFTFMGLTDRDDSGRLALAKRWESVKTTAIIVAGLLLFPLLLLAAGGNTLALGDHLAFMARDHFQGSDAQEVVRVVAWVVAAWGGLLCAVGFIFFILLPVAVLPGVLAAVVGMAAFGFGLWGSLMNPEQLQGISAAPWLCLAALLLGPLVTWLGVVLARINFRELVKDTGSGVKGLWTSAGGFLLGPMPPRVDALADERRLTALIRARQGLLTLGDLVGLFGWTPAQAQRELTRICVDYQGDILVTPSGAVVIDFPALSSMDPAGVPAPQRLTSPVLPTPAWLGCSWRFTLTVLLILALGLCGVLLHPYLHLLPDAQTFTAVIRDTFYDRSHSGPARIGLYEGPLLFLQTGGVWTYVAWVVLPVFRLPLWVRQWVQHPADMERALLLHAAATQPQGFRMRVRHPRQLAALGATVDEESLDDDGRLVVRFDDLALAALEAARIAAERTSA